MTILSVWIASVGAVTHLVTLWIDGITIHQERARRFSSFEKECRTGSVDSRLFIENKLKFIVVFERFETNCVV